MIRFKQQLNVVNSIQDRNAAAAATKGQEVI